MRSLLGTLTVIGCVMLSDARAGEGLPPLKVTAIRAGQSYITDGDGTNTWGKILQVIDDSNMLVGIDNGGTNPGGRPRYSVTVWCKFRTKGLTDGKTDFLANILGTMKVTASGTTKYKTAAGGTRTIFVLEPAKQPAKGKDLPAATVKAPAKDGDPWTAEGVIKFGGNWVTMNTDREAVRAKVVSKLTKVRWKGKPTAHGALRSGQTVRMLYNSATKVALSIDILAEPKKE